MSEAVRAQQRRHWDNVAAGWSAWGDWTDRNFAPLTRWLADAAWRPGARVLDIACGAGYPALAAAAAVQPGGAVVATDLSPPMLEAAAQRAAAAGLGNVQFRVMDAEQLDFDDASFDAVTNTYGLMFCPDPQRAMREAYRVLKPGGCFAVVVWDEMARSPFFEVITTVGRRMLGMPTPDPDSPNPFRFAPAGKLAALFADGPFSSVTVEQLSMTFELASVTEYCELFGDVAWKAKLNALSSTERTGFEQAVAAAARPYSDGARLRLATVSLCASVRK